MKLYVDGGGYTLTTLPEPAWYLDKDQSWSPGKRKLRRHLPTNGKNTEKRPSLSELDGERS